MYDKPHSLCHKPECEKYLCMLTGMYADIVIYGIQLQRSCMGHATFQLYPILNQICAVQYSYFVIVFLLSFLSIIYAECL